MFFKPKPNLPDVEKARIEFHVQQIAQCIGSDRVQLPVVSRSVLLGWYESNQTPEQMVSLVGKHLGHDVGGVRIKIDPQQTQDCSGGG